MFLLYSFPQYIDYAEKLVHVGRPAFEKAFMGPKLELLKTFKGVESLPSRKEKRRIKNSPVCQDQITVVTHTHTHTLEGIKDRKTGWVGSCDPFV